MGHADAHSVAGTIFGQDGLSDFNHFHAEGAGFADREATDGVAMGVEVEKAGGAFAAEVGEHGALDDGEEGLAGGILVLTEAVVVKTSFGPANGAFHGGSGGFVADGVGRAFVEDHHDVAAEGQLGVDGGGRGEFVGVSVEVGLEGDAFFGNFPQGGQAEDLEATRVGEDGTGPVHEFVEAAEFSDQFVAGAEVQVIGVAEDDGGLEFVVEVALGEAFNGALGADGHEDGGGDVAVGGVEDTGPGFGFRTLCKEFEGDLAGQVFSLGGGAERPLGYGPVDEPTRVPGAPDLR